MRPTGPEVPLAVAAIGEEGAQRIAEVLRSGNLTMGHQVEAFEEEMAAFLGVKHFVMVNSGSSANLLMVEALLRPAIGEPLLRPGDGVIVPAIAWPTTIWPVIQLGLEPIFVDVDPDTLALDPEKIAELLDSSGFRSVRAIFIIHPLGLALDMTPFTKLADEHGLLLLSDVCESLGARRDGLHAGSTSVMSSYSFYFSHHITTMEGGGVATDSQVLRDDLVSMRSHGWSRQRSDSEVFSRGINASDAKFRFVTTGYNVRPMEIQGALGRAQLGSVETFLSSRRAMAKRVHESLKNTKLELIRGDALPEELDPRHSWMLFPIRLRTGFGSAEREKILNFLESSGVATRPVLTGNFLAQPSVRQIFKHWPNPGAFPIAQNVSETCFMVGAHHGFSEAQIGHMCDALVAASNLLD